MQAVVMTSAQVYIPMLGEDVGIKHSSTGHCTFKRLVCGTRQGAAVSGLKLAIAELTA